MRILENTEPRSVLRYFEEISAIPHGSGNMKAIAQYCVQFAEREGLEYHRDSHDNVVIIREASAGYEGAEPILLQGHLDMVCEKTPECTLDMEKDALQLKVEGDWLRAEGTTLGGDDGIAVAMILALLSEKELCHPRLEAILTTDEETGMLGAAELDPTPLRGRRMINLDSDEEGVFTVSCAGGNVTHCMLPLNRECVHGRAFALTVGGLTGGHSGAEIDKGRANSNRLLGRMLYDLEKETPFSLISVEGGQKDNAIPRESTALLAPHDPAALTAFILRWEQDLKTEYGTAEPELFVRAEPREGQDWQAMTPQTAANVVGLLLTLPGGIQAMSNELPGLVQTSLNLGILKTEQEQLTASFCVRSAVASQKQMLVDRLTCLTESFGGSTEIYGDYPAWEYRRESPLRKLLVEVFREQYGHEPKVNAIHAGLECGLLCGKLPGLDCVSLGPDIREIHTPREEMSLSSVHRLWEYLLEVLRRAR